MQRELGEGKREGVKRTRKARNEGMGDRQECGQWPFHQGQIL